MRGLVQTSSEETMTPVTPADRPKSVCNRCVIKDFGGVFVLSLDVHFLIVWGLLF